MFPASLSLNFRPIFLPFPPLLVFRSLLFCTSICLFFARKSYLFCTISRILSTPRRTNEHHCLSLSLSLWRLSSLNASLSSVKPPFCTKSAIRSAPYEALQCSGKNRECIVGRRSGCRIGMPLGRYGCVLPISDKKARCSRAHRPRRIPYVSSAKSSSLSPAKS